MYTHLFFLPPSSDNREGETGAERQTAAAGGAPFKSGIVSLALSWGYKGLIVSSITWKMLKERCEFNVVCPQPRLSVTRKRDGGFTLSVFVYKWPLSRIPEVTGMTGASGYCQGHQEKWVLAYAVHMCVKLEHLVPACVFGNSERDSLLQHTLIRGIPNKQKELTLTVM